MKNIIKGYKLETDFVNTGAGMSTWCIASKEGKKYFIKSFLEETIVDEEMEANLPAPMVEAKRKRCIQFRIRKERLYNKLNEIQNGVFVSPIELFVYNGHYCAVSDYLESFRDSESIHSFDPHRKAVLMRTMVLAMRDLSDNHIVHSDIKPDNIVILSSPKMIPQLKIIDFDSGFFEDAPPRNVDEYHGDMAYFAPESMLFLQSERESDIRLTCSVDKFAIGLLLHKMWCGTLPSYDAECSNVAEALLLDRPITLDNSIPGKLSKVINGFLRYDPDSRMSYNRAYDLIGELMAELQETEKEVSVICADTKGKVLETFTLKIAYGSELRILPKSIKGYKCLDRKYLLRVDDTGVSEPSSVQFRYKKKNQNVWMWLIAFLGTVVLIWWIFASGNAYAEIPDDNWEEKNNYSAVYSFYEAVSLEYTPTIHAENGEAYDLQTLWKTD